MKIDAVVTADDIPDDIERYEEEVAEKTVKRLKELKDKLYYPETLSDEVLVADNLDVWDHVSDLDVSDACNEFYRARDKILEEMDEATLKKIERLSEDPSTFVYWKIMDSLSDDSLVELFKDLCLDLSPWDKLFEENDDEEDNVTRSPICFDWEDDDAEAECDDDLK